MVNVLQIMQGKSNCGWQEIRSEMQPCTWNLCSCFCIYALGKRLSWFEILSLQIYGYNFYSPCFYDFNETAARRQNAIYEQIWTTDRSNGRMAAAMLLFERDKIFLVTYIFSILTMLCKLVISLLCVNRMNIAPLLYGME